MRLKFIFTLAVVCGFSFTCLKAQQTAKITSSGIGFWEYLPQDYNQNNNDYPIVIFLHGIGEKGTTSSDPTTIKNSLQQVTRVGLAKNVKYGKDYPFILISPQLKSSYGRWPANYVMSVLEHVKKYLRINERRIYITGLSLGGYGTWTTLAAYPEVFAAAVPICSGGSEVSRACDIAEENVALWAFHGTSDNVVSYTVTTRMINAVNACTPTPDPLAKTTLFSGMGHSIWDKVYNDTNALDWMLRFTNGSSSTDDGSASNNPPVVSAGANKSLTLPTNEVYIQGSASDSDGAIAYYKWTKISGGTASLGGTTGSKLRAYNLLEGSYVFRLTVKDNDGASRYDDMRVTVSAASVTNAEPVAYAGSDKFTSSSSIKLYGSGKDSDGSIVSYKWVKYYGGAVTLTNANSPTVTVSGMKDGNYFLRLTVTDDKGATDYDNMKVSVSGGTIEEAPSTANISPVANAGSNRDASSNTITIRGYGSDKDGKIVSYKWIQYGGAAATLTNANMPTVTVSDLKDGRYYLRLTVTDDKGASDYDNMLIRVNVSTATSSINNIDPVSLAGPNRRVTTETSSLRVFGSGSDEDGNIISYHWRQYAGPRNIITLRNRDAATLTVTDLDEGKYYLKLTVEDDEGAVNDDNMLIVVNEG